MTLFPYFCKSSHVSIWIIIVICIRYVIVLYSIASFIRKVASIYRDTQMTIDGHCVVIAVTNKGTWQVKCLMLCLTMVPYTHWYLILNVRITEDKIYYPTLMLSLIEFLTFFCCCWSIGLIFRYGCSSIPGVEPLYRKQCDQHYFVLRKQ
jgi:hypothetical protein